LRKENRRIWRGFHTVSLGPAAEDVLINEFCSYREIEVPLYSDFPYQHLPQGLASVEAKSLPVPQQNRGSPTLIEMKYSRVLEISMPSTATGITLSMAVAFVSCVCISIWRLLNPVSKKEKLSLDFSDIKPLHGFDLVNTPPYPWRPWRVGKFQMTMGLRKMPEDDWLILDNLYKEEQAFRTHLLESNRNGVMQVLPVAEEACAETLEYIVEFLIRRFPSLFRRPYGKPEYIHNLVTNKTFRTTAPYDEHPLAVAAQLVMEDINLLMQGTGEDPKEYYL
jgi:hypothetical protein